MGKDRFKVLGDLNGLCSDNCYQLNRAAHSLVVCALSAYLDMLNLADRLVPF
jgi:hypothetical protein